MEKKQKEFSLWYFVIAFLILIAIENFLLSSHLENLSYSDFKVLLKAGKVEDLTLREKVISGKLKKEGLEGLLPKEKIEELQRLGKGEYHFVAVRVDDPSLIQELEAAKVRFAGQVENTWLLSLMSWVLPAVIFFALWFFFMKRMGAARGIMEIGKSKAKVYMEKQTGMTFDDVAGVDEESALAWPHLKSRAPLPF